MGYKNDWRYIEQSINVLKNKYNFKGLYHFTDFSNLKNIFETGYLFSRNDCYRNSINFADGANHEVLEKDVNDVHEKVRFYYRAKTPTLYDNEGVKLEQYCNEVHIPMPVYLLFDEELIYLDNTEFSNGNATTSSIGNTSTFFNTMDWNAIFHSTWFYPEERNYIVNKRHAELLSYKPVPIKKYLKKIIFRCEADKKRAINVYGHNSLYEVDINLFSDKNTYEARRDWQKNNFIKNYSIDYTFDEFGDKKELIVKIEFQKPCTDYKARFNLQSIDVKDNSYKTIKIYDEVEKYYIDEFGEIKNNRENCKIVVLKLNGNIEKADKFESYINDYLYIEEYLNKDKIIDYEVQIKTIDKVENFILNTQFANLEILRHNHRCQILDVNDKVLYECRLNFGESSNVLNWVVKFDKYNKIWYKIKYYIDDVMYICDLVHSNNMIHATE